MKKMFIAFNLLTAIVNLGAQNLDVTSDNQKETDFQERRARLIEILKDVPADSTQLSNEPLIAIIRKKQDEISDLYKIDYDEWQNLNKQDRYRFFTAGALTIATAGLVLYGIHTAREIAKARSNYMALYEHAPIKDLLNNEDKLRGNLALFNFLVTLGMAGFYCWTLFFNNSAVANSDDMQKLRDEFAFLEDEIKLIQNENCKPQSKTVEARMLDR